MQTIIVNEKLLDNKKAILQTIRETYDNGFNYEYYKILLPYLTHDELLARYKNIKPIVYYNNNFYNLKKYNEKMLRNESYIYNLKNNIRDIIDLNESEILDDFNCYHKYGNMNLFKPSIAEILEQFPDNLLDEANAFYMIDYPNDVTDLNNQLDILKAGCHKSTIRALKLKR